MKALYDQDGYDEFVESLYEKHLDDMDWDADVELDVLDELIDVSKTNTFFDEGTQKEYMDAVEAMGNIRREHVNTVREEDETKGFARIVEKTGICELQSVDIHGFECHFCEAKYSDEKYIIIYQKDTHIRDIIDNEEEWSNFQRELYREDIRQDNSKAMVYIVYILDDNSDNIPIQVIESNKTYGRKYVFSEDETITFINGIVKTSSDEISAASPVQEWDRILREEHLTACLTEPYSAKKVASYLGGQRFDADYVHDDDYSTMKHSKVPQIKWVKSLETTGFRDFCFDQKMMTFGQINLFYGANGSGKTSVLEAIEYALTAEVRRVKDFKVKLPTDSFPKLHIYDTEAGVHTFTPGFSKKNNKEIERVWYGVPIGRTKSNLNENFNRFNAFDSEAAYKFIHESDNSEDSFASMFGNLMFGETVVDHEKKWQRFKRAFNDRYTELRSELSEARNMADIYERSLAQKTDSSKSEEIEAGIIALKLIGRARLPKGSSDRYPKILEEMKAIRKYVDVLSVHNMERMRFKAIAAQVTEAKKNNLLYTRRRKDKSEEITRLAEENGTIKKKIFDEREKQTGIQQRLDCVNTDIRNWTIIQNVLSHEETIKLVNDLLGELTQIERELYHISKIEQRCCDDYLDKEPESNVTPASFFTSADDLAAYTVNLYGVLTSIAPGSYGMSTFAYDNDTDNQAGTGYSSRWVPGNWKVGQSGGAWDFGNIRSVNYFLDQVLPKFEAKQISGAEAHVRHYIGEAYFLRAYLYLDKLQSLGDFPIVLTALPDDKETLVEASKRQPRYKVAQQILDDLDKALGLLMESAPGGKNRISRDAALLLRSRAALFEATWEKYHKGTAFVPGGPGWPGKAEDIQGFDIDSSINHFLDEAMKSSKELGDKLVDNLVENTDTPEGQNASLASINPYYTMFCDKDMSGYSEVLMYRAFDKDKANVTHNIQMQLQRNGGGTGWTRGLVNSFLMRNGLPIYAAGSGYNPEWENQGIKATLQDRDSRIQIFTKMDGSVENYTSDGANTVDLSWTVKGNNETRIVTGYAVKKGKNYDVLQQLNHDYGQSGSIVFRGTEALLNYMEASWLKNNTIDATADKYWRALRTRAKVDPDYNKTIAATNMQEEAKWDFGAYSHGQLVDATTYNIRRERRDEFIGEASRWEDLIRWRACDQVNGYQIEGMKYWGTVYEGTWLDGETNLAIVDVEGGKGNMSDKTISGDYIRPYQISKINNQVFDGYHFTPAHYLSPIAQSVFRQTAAGDQTDLTTSVVYQNPGWPLVAGQGATAVE